MKPPKDLKRGSIIAYMWVDPCADPVGDTTKAELALRGPTYGVVWDVKKKSKGQSCLVTSNTLDTDGPTQQGYDIVPWVLVKGVVILELTSDLVKQLKEASNAS